MPWVSLEIAESVFRLDFGRYRRSIENEAILYCNLSLDTFNDSRCGLF